MYIVIVGLGGIGRALAAISIENGNSVAVIDQDEERCNEIIEHYDVLAIAGNATSRSILLDAGIDRAQALITTTSDDAVNLMTCWLAKKFDVPNVISIVNQKDHSEMFKEVGVHISENPDELVAQRLYFWSKNTDLHQIASIPGGSIFEIDVDDTALMIDHEIKELEVTNFVFIAIKREKGDIIIPSGKVRIRKGDKIIVFTKKDTEKDCLNYLNRQLKRSV
jgi:trk system potassium uptake protein TrkA